MKLTFQKTALLNGINIVLKAVPSKTTMPILRVHPDRRIYR